jgi:NADH:ubiquinone oxidoreductase subunit F (NADH-binding)
VRDAPTKPPLFVLRDSLRREPEVDVAAVRRLAEETGFSPAGIRAAVSYYADLHAEPGAFRICRGTSCTLNGGEELYRMLGATNPCRAVYCIGYCDRSPAVLRPDGSVVADATSHEPKDVPTAPTADPRPSAIRSLAAEPIVTTRIARGDHSSLERAKAAGVYEGLHAALHRKPTEIVEMIERSRERGRGGAAYPTGKKWRLCAETSADERFVIANGDEGDPGAFIDRALLEEDPHAILEGAAIAAYAVGAKQVIVFIRSEYPRAVSRIAKAIHEAEAAGLFSQGPLDLDVTLFPGLGSYVCGEETAMLAAIEGRRGEVSPRPPYPAVSGLHGKPTVVDNVETLVNVPWIVTRGPERYAALGTPVSSGTKALCLNRGFERPGIVEVEFGTPLREVVEVAAGGGRRGEGLAAVLLGGPMGSVVPPDRWDVPICYGAMAARGIDLGHGGLVALPESADFAAVLRHWLRFMRDESCGRCVPCAMGSRRAVEIAERLDEESLDRLRRLCDVVGATSLCAFGQFLPRPIRQLVDLFGERMSTAPAEKAR